MVLLRPHGLKEGVELLHGIPLPVKDVPCGHCHILTKGFDPSIVVKGARHHHGVDVVDLMMGVGVLEAFLRHFLHRSQKVGTVNDIDRAREMRGDIYLLLDCSCLVSSAHEVLDVNYYGHPRLGAFIPIMGTTRVRNGRFPKKTGLV